MRQHPVSSRRLALGLLAALVAAFALGACTHYRSPGERLRVAVLHYNDAIRWQQWKAAARFVPADKRSDFVDRKEAQQDSVRITEYEVRDVHHEDAADPPAAKVTVEFTWHRYPSLTMHRTRVKQSWTMLGEEDWILKGQEEVEFPAEPETAADMF